MGAGLLPALGIAAITYAASQAIAYGYDTSTDFKSAVDSFNEVVYDAIVDVAEWTRDVMRDVSDFAETLSEDITVAKNQIADWVVDRAVSLGEAINQTFPGAADGLNDALQGLRDFLDTAQEMYDNIESGDFTDFSYDTLDYLDGLLAPLFDDGGPSSGTPVSDAISDAANWFRDNFISPIVLDLNGQSNLQLSQIADSHAFFDLDNDGFAENPGWTSQEGILAHDANANGVIDNQGELFGQTEGSSAWDKLRPYDTNNNGIISGTERNPLKIWIDADGDGVTDSGELKTLQQAGVASINLTNTNDHFWVGDHEIIGGGSWTKTAGGAGKYYDVFFKTDQLNSWYVGDDLTSPPEVDIETLFLPLPRGYGSIKSLHYAMTEKAA